MNETRPGATLHFGKDAIEQFRNCLNSFFEDDATGKLYGAYRAEHSELRMVGMTMCRSEAIAELISDPERIGELDQYQMLVLDSGNSHGDSWIATFYPRQCMMTLIDQRALEKQPAVQCVSCGGSEDAGFREGQCRACAGHSDDNAMTTADQASQRGTMTGETLVPALLDVVSRYNNASVKSTCPVCRECFKPSIGDWDFLVGTWHPVCENCSTEIRVRNPNCPF